MESLLGPGTHRIAADRLDPTGFAALQDCGHDIVDGQEVANFAHMIKLPEERRHPHRNGRM